MSPMAKNQKHIDLIKAFLSIFVSFVKFSTLMTSHHDSWLPFRFPFTFVPFNSVFFFFFFFQPSCSCVSQRGASALLLSRMFRQLVCRGGKMERQHSSETLAPRIIMQRRVGGWGPCRASDGQTETELIYMLTESSSSQQPAAISWQTSDEQTPFSLSSQIEEIRVSSPP